MHTGKWVLSDNPDGFSVITLMILTMAGLMKMKHRAQKQMYRNLMPYWTEKGKDRLLYNHPSKIWVNGNFAYVHYYYTQVTENADGKPNTEKGRWTDILMKKGDKWMLVGDHGGEIKSED